MTLKVKKKNKWNISLKWVKKTEKKFSLYSKFFFLLFGLLDLRPNQLFPEKISKIKIFVKSNQFLFNIFTHLPWGLHTTK